MSKTYKEREEQKSLSKNNGKHIRYRRRIQEQVEAEQEKKEALRRLNQYEKNEYEDF